MRVLVIGGTGTIGSAVVENFSSDNEVLVAGHSQGDYQVDIASPESIRRLFQQTGAVDAVVSCAGRAAFGALDELADEEFQFSIDNKLMGQVNLVRLGTQHVRDGGSFTLTSGVLAQEPTPGSAAITLVNSGLEGFARAAALELPREIRVNVVSPPWVSETLSSMGRDPSAGLAAGVVANAYREAIRSSYSGQVIDARKHG